MGPREYAIFIFLIQLVNPQMSKGIDTVHVSQGDDDIEVVWPRRNPEIEDFLLTSSIESRYAMSHITSVIRNKEDEATETVFSARTPKSAFISGFSMLLNGKVYKGEVKEKYVSPKKESEKFRSKSQRTENLADNTRNINIFRVSVTLSAHSIAIFNLTYEELLVRKLGYYDYVLDIDPGQIIKNLKINIRIGDTMDLAKLEVPPVRKIDSGDFYSKRVNPLARIRRMSLKSVEISLEPTPKQQLEESPQGIAGQFIVRYDITRPKGAGEIQMADSRFVHFFAPTNLPTIPKDIIFILDISGSMSGSKLSQTKEAMCNIVDALHLGDRFNIMTFSSYLRYWNRNTIQEANQKNKKKAKIFLRGMTAEGGTNINDAILRGIDFMKRQTVSLDDLPRAFLIVFLTDGEPTSGITHTEQILTNVRKSNQGKYMVFGLGLGNSADINFLHRLSIQNRGYAKWISDSPDTDIQLEMFFLEISNPLLSEVHIAYPGNALDKYGNLQYYFPTYFKGSELAVAGTLSTPANRTLIIRASGESDNGTLSMITVSGPKTDPLKINPDVIKRTWAYVTVRELLVKLIKCSNQSERIAYERTALNISLQFSFVNRWTSMVVMKPEEPHKMVGTFRDPDEDGKGRTGRRGTNRKTMHGILSRPLSDRRTPFVDNDPHFIISLNGSKETVCFDISGRIGDIYQLVFDRVSGIVVNSEVVGKNPGDGRHPRTYFGKITAMDREVTVTVSPSKVQINDRLFTWRHDVSYGIGNVYVDIRARKNVTVTFMDGVTFIIARHKVRKYHPIKVDYLGFYMNDGSGLSVHTDGLIGQFHHKHLTVESYHDSRHPHQLFARLKLHGPRARKRTIRARRRHRMNMLTRAHVPCWQVANNGRDFIAGTHEDYLVPDIHYRDSAVRFAKLRQLFP